MASLKTNNPIQLVQITDTHLYGDADGTLLKMNTHDSFAHVLDIVREHEDSIDLILATGDIAQDASAKAYEHFQKEIKILDAPFRWIPGNHDSAQVMAEVAKGSAVCEKVIQINNWMIFMLDTSIEGQVHGRLAPAELEFLEENLAAAEQEDSVDHILVCLHHNPIKGNSGWMKDIGLHNKERFWEILSKSEKLKCVVYGHVHQELDFEHNGIRCLCTPSTCIQFKPNVVNFALDPVNPGYRTLQLHEDGSIDTKVYRVEGEIFEVDYSSGGY
ncbi:MAG: 3',5'-cyclic-AMP phosphodiesterase [Proteobacteria bacterium]|nr:3',5'-cyclic-AMP phosphodiesterase [Pseudomonadota bacterium]